MATGGWAWKVRSGDFVASVGMDGLPVRGKVVASAPDAGVVWIREDGLGERRMLLMVDLRPEAPPETQ